MDTQTQTDIIHQKIYDFLLYIYPLLAKYPKFEKFSLQTATRNAILEMLQEVIKWDKTATKSHLYRKVRKDSIKRIKRTIKKCESGKITKEQLQKSIQSWTGHAGHADSYNLRKKIETLAEAAIEKAA